MRTKEEMLKLIMDVAAKDERIRAVTMEGSQVSKNVSAGTAEGYVRLFINEYEVGGENL